MSTDEAEMSFEERMQQRKQEIADAHAVERGSLSATLRRARLFDPKITMQDVKKWRLENLNMEKRPTKPNSWVGNYAKEEYQADLLFFDDLKERIESINEKGEKVMVKVSDSFDAGLMVVDSFSKKMAVVPMVNKTNPAIIAGLETAFERLGGKPKMLYTDAEGALTSNAVQAWLQREKIVHNITMTHAALAEKMIGYLKERVVRHIREEEALNTDKKVKWYDVMDAVVKKYNEEHVSRTTKMTPNEAAEPENKAKVKTNLESVRRSSNPQPRIQVGDKVRVIKKKANFEKSYVPNYTEELFTVEELVKPNFTPEDVKEKVKNKGKKKTEEAIQEPAKEKDVFNPQVQYKLSDPNNKLPHYKKTFMRSELLLTNKKV
jgi:hypothetical protein